MSCAWTHARLSPWLEGDLDPGAQRTLASHLETCPGCRDELAALRAGVAQLHGLRALEAPPQLAQRVIASVREAGSEEPERGPFAVALRLAVHFTLAACVATLAVVASHRLGDRGGRELAAELAAVQSAASGRVGLGEHFGASAPPSEPTQAEIDAALDRALVDAGVLVRGLRSRGEPARELWLRSLVERARERGDAAVLAAALRTRSEPEADVLADQLAARP